MNQNLSRGQSIGLGLLVLAILVVASSGLLALANKQGLWADHTEVTVGFAEVNDIYPGTPVRLRGLEVGQVVAMEYPELEGAEAWVRVRLKIKKEYADRLNADASAQIQSTGLLSGKVIALAAGDPRLGPLIGSELRTGKSDSWAETAAKLNEVADETRQLLHGIRAGQGTVGKLLQDEALYQDLKGLAKDSRTMVQEAQGAVQRVESQVSNVERFVEDGRETLRSTRSTVDGVNQSWLGRQFLDNATQTLVRPRHRREAVTYATSDLFESGTAILTDPGRAHLAEVVKWLKSNHPSEADVVVAALCDPEDYRQTASSALELTRKQSETVVEFLKSQGAHKISWVSKRKFTALGLGQGPSPAVEPTTLPPSYLQVLLFTPQ